jgi:hypothetical protein
VKNLKSFLGIFTVTALLFCAAACGSGDSAVTAEATIAVAPVTVSETTVTVPETTAPETTTTAVTSKPFRFELTGSFYHGVSLNLADRGAYRSLEAYLEAVKNEIENKESIGTIEFFSGVSSDSGYNPSKETWDKIFQFIKDNKYDFTSIYFDNVDLNDIVGVANLSENPDFKSIRINGNNETELRNDFPDLSNITYLKIQNANPDLIKHFPNLREIYYENGSPDIEKTIVRNCKNITAINNDGISNKLYDEIIREDLTGYSSVSGKGKINGGFTVTYIEGDEVNTNYLDYEFSDYDDEDGIIYADNCRDCDFYVLVTVENEKKYGTYGNGVTVGYKRDYYVQIFDIKNGIKHKKEFISTSYPPTFFQYYAGRAPAKKYGSAPVDEIVAFIKDAIGES